MKANNTIIFYGISIIFVASLFGADKDPNIVWPSQKPTQQIAMLPLEKQYPATVPLLLEEMKRTSIEDVQQRVDRIHSKNQQLSAKEKDNDPDFKKEISMGTCIDTIKTIYRPIFIRLKQSFDTTTINTPIAQTMFILVHEKESARNTEHSIKHEADKTTLTLPSKQKLDEYTRYTIENNTIHCTTKITDLSLIRTIIERAPDMLREESIDEYIELPTPTWASINQ